MFNIAEKLKNVREGFELYSPIFGTVYLKEVDSKNEIIAIYIKDPQEPIFYFNKYGRYNSGYAEKEGECLLFPSKEVREWGNFLLGPKVSYNFKPFDMVLVRDFETAIWQADLFSHISLPNKYRPFVCLGGRLWSYCLPYNKETAKLIGTTDDYKD